jgi:glycosyltransferase involved in cell wall biosynthesis
MSNMKAGSLKIMMITPFFSPNIGGVETHLDDLCKYLVSRGYTVSVITYQPLISKRKVASFEVNGKVTIRRISWIGYGLFNKFEPYPLFEVMYLFPALFLRTLLFGLSNKKDVDIIVAQGLVASLVGKFVKPVLRKPAIATVHTIYYLDTRPMVGRIFGWILRSYDKILFVSNKIREEFVNFGIDSSKTGVFTYWADNSRFKPLDKKEAKKTLGWADTFVVLFVGRLIKEKGVDVLVKAAARMTDKRVFYAFVTSGSYEEFKTMVGGVVPSNVIYVGPVEYSKLHFYYNAADIFVLPSQKREGFSRAVLEAVLCGTPVVVSNVGCLPEVVNSRIGRLVDPPTAENFRKVIEYYWNHKADLERLSKACIEYGQKHFAESINAKIVEEDYHIKKGAVR